MDIGMATFSTTASQVADSEDRGWPSCVVLFQREKSGVLDVFGFRA
jgi:hypothetical protein